MISTKNKRIGKNTILLYFRTLFTMFLGLYISRLVLNELGVNDYGIYSLVGGIVALFSFLNNSMAVATQRFLSFELGRDSNQKKLNEVFCTSINIHIIISIIVFVLLETVGLWLLFNKIIIPENRQLIAFWVFQLSIFSLIINIISIPYNGLIIARENMSAFAFIDMFVSIIKLLMVVSISFLHYDKLLLYSFLMLIVTFLTRQIYSYLCSKKYKEAKYHFYWNKELFMKMISFASWTTISSFTSILKKQGIDVLLNLFGGVTANAALGIAKQVNNAINLFSQNFQTAFIPQITKSYAEGDLIYTNKLVFTGAKLSFALLLLFSLPIIIESEFVLTIWLKNVPHYSNVFVSLMLIDTLIKSLTCTINTAIRATGDIKYYEMIMNTITLISLLFCYLALKIGLSIYTPFYVFIVFQIITGLVMVLITSKKVRFSFYKYLYHVFARMTLVTILSVLFPYLLYRYMEYGFLRFISVGVVSVILILVFTYFIGLQKHEKELANKILNEVLMRVKIK